MTTEFKIELITFDYCLLLFDFPARAKQKSFQAQPPFLSPCLSHKPAAQSPRERGHSANISNNNPHYLQPRCSCTLMQSISNSGFQAFAIRWSLRDTQPLTCPIIPAVTNSGGVHLNPRFLLSTSSPVQPKKTKNEGSPSSVNVNW